MEPVASFHLTSTEETHMSASLTTMMASHGVLPRMTTPKTTYGETVQVRCMQNE